MQADKQWPRNGFFDNPADTFPGDQPADDGFQFLLFRELTKEEVAKIEATFQERDIYIEQQYHAGAWDSSWIDGSPSIKEEMKALLISFGITEEKQ